MYIGFDKIVFETDCLVENKGIKFRFSCDFEIDNFLSIDMDSTAIEYIYNNGYTEYLPFFKLSLIQVEEISQDFKKSIVEVQSILDGEIYEDSMEDYSSNILVSLYIQEIMRNENLWMSFVKDKSKMKFEKIYETIKEIDSNDAFKEEDVYGGINERTHGADVCSSSLKIHALMCR